tara:strand:- start:536 stop:1441 length:906 start_codon:yes stop_codon:yes gene_type:complete
MRNKFSETIYNLSKKNKKIYVVASDISPSGKMAKFQSQKKNFINVGVSEQVMIGVCAGLALSGMKPFAYTIAPFSIFRPFEMVRDDLCYQKLPVTVVGMGAGTVYANLGGTHTSIEDISIARSLPNMQVLSPCDPLELESCINFCANKSKKPSYLRIGKTGEKNYTSKSTEKWEFGKIRKIKNGKDICILLHGPIISMAFEVDRKIKKNLSIYSCHTLKPFDEKKMKSIFKKYKKIITLEDHSEIGGLSELVKISAYQNKYKGEIKFFSLKDDFLHIYSSQKDLLNAHGISVSKLLKQIKN